MSLYCYYYIWHCAYQTYIIIDGDYTSGSYSVTFPAGRTRAVFDVSVTNDNILEVNESFSLAVDPVTLPSNVTSVDQTTITITDNDSKLYNNIHSCMHSNFLNAWDVEGMVPFPHLCSRTYVPALMLAT